MEIPLRHYYHELGHSFFCFIFADSIEFFGIHYDEDTLKRASYKNWKGAIHVRGIPKMMYAYPTAYFIKVIIVGFAGGCVENTLSLESCDIDRFIKKFSEQPDEFLDMTNMSGDFDSIIKPNESLCITEAQTTEFRKSVYAFIFSVLNDKAVYQCLSSIAQELYENQDISLEGDVVRNLFDVSGLYTYIENMRTRIMEDFHERFDQYSTRDDVLRTVLREEAIRKGKDIASFFQ